MSEIPLQIDMFSGELVDARSAKQKKHDNNTPHEQMQMFSSREVLQFGVNAHPLMPINEGTRLGLELLDTRTDEEKDHDLMREAELLTVPLFAPPDGHEPAVLSSQPLLLTAPLISGLLPAWCDAGDETEITDDRLLYERGIIFDWQFPLV